MKTLVALFVSVLLFAPALGDDGEIDTDELPAVVMYKDPTCGCCEKWADHMRAHGFSVKSVPSEDMLSIKTLRNVPPQGSSCHTADIGDLVVEGHVPARDILKLLSGHRDDVRLLTVPAMPLGSPGMEHPRPQAFRTYAVTDSDEVEIYAEHAAGEDFSPEG